MKSGESGMVMIEAIYVTVITILIVFFTINAGAIYYNRIVLTSIADEAANGVAQIYGSTGKEPFYNYTGYSYFEKKSAYRYWFNGAHKLDDTAKEKAKWYASYLVYTREFSHDKKLDFSGITVECAKSSINMQTLTVNIKRTYPVFIMNPVSFWGLDPQYEINVSGSAVCYDAVHQMNSVSFKNELMAKIDKSSTSLTIINKVVGLARTIKDELFSDKN